MTDTTPRLALPLIQPGQAQKELFHNEALVTLDAAMHPVAETLGETMPPATPAIGAAWIVGAAPGGAWAGQAARLAIWSAGGWRFVAMPEGALVWVRADAVHARRTASGWSTGEIAAKRVRINGDQVLGARSSPIPDPAGGATIDIQVRGSVNAILAALRNHGLIGT